MPESTSDNFMEEFLYRAPDVEEFHQRLKFILRATHETGVKDVLAELLLEHLITEEVVEEFKKTSRANLHM